MNFALGSPLLLATAALGAAVIAVYIFHRRPREREVSSLLLWQGLIQPGGAGRQREQFRAPWLLALELLAILLLALAAAQPLLTSGVSGRSVILILDDSASMTAAPDSGLSPRERAAEELPGLLRDYNPSRTAFVLASSTPNLLSMNSGSAQTQEMLRSWTCRAAGADLLGAIRLALELGTGSTEVLVVTDHAPPPDTDYGPRVRWLAFGQPLPNVAISAAARSSSSDASVVVEVTNHTDQPAQRSLSIERDGAAPVTRSVSLGAGATGRYRLPIDSEAEVTVRLNPPDALRADDSVLLVPEDTRPISVAVRTTDESLRGAAERWIDADPSVTPSIVNRPELLVTDDTDPPPPGAWAVRIVRPTGSAVRPYSGPFVLNREHQLAEGLDLSGVVWAADLGDEPPVAQAAGLVSSEPILTLASRTVVEQRRFIDGHHETLITIDPEQSNLSSQVAWPVLLANAARLRRESRPGPVMTNVRVGQPVRISAPQGSTDPILVTEPDGNERSIRTASTSYTPPVPGRYTVRAGEDIFFLAANLLAPTESDLRSAAEVRVEPETAGLLDSVLSTRNLAWLAAIVVAIAIAIHGLVVSLTYRRGGSV